MYLIADGQYGPHVFDDPLSGDEYIYLRKATVGSHGRDAGWDDAYGDGEAMFVSAEAVWEVSTGYLDIDGQVGAGRSPGEYGFRIQSTRSRCSGGDLLFYSADVTNLAVRHVDFDWDNGTASCEGRVTSSISSGTNTSDSVTIEDNYFHHSSGYVFYLGNYTGRPVQSHYLIQRNYFYSNGGGGGPSAHWELMWLTDLENSDITNNTSWGKGTLTGRSSLAPVSLN